jgi:hypothetical protein
MTVAMLPMLRKAEAPNVTVIASIAGLANQRYVSDSLSMLSSLHTLHPGLYPVLARLPVLRVSRPLVPLFSFLLGLS